MFNCGCNAEKEAVLTNHDMIAAALENYRGKVLTTGEILNALPRFVSGRIKTSQGWSV